MSLLRSLLTNIFTLLLALILALIIWTSAAQTEDPIRTRFLQVPVNYVGQPTNSTLIRGNTTDSVQVRIEGPDSLLQQLVPDDFTATVDLSQVPFGEATLARVDVTSSESGVEISFITPSEIEVLLEEEVTRNIPVELDIRGTPGRGHTQGEALIEPPEITVSGPASRVNALDFALVTTFLNNAVETTTDVQQPIFYDVQGRVASTNGLLLSTQTVEVTIPIEESAGFGEKVVNVVWSGEPAEGYRLLGVTADPPSVLVEGRPTQVNLLSSVNTEEIDVTGLTESFEQQAVLNLPTGITVSPEQASVSVHFQIEPILTTSTFNRVPELIGLEEGLQATLVPDEVRVVLFGPLPVLDSLREQDVRVTLDLTGLDIGIYSVEPEVEIPDRDIELRSVQPLVIAVTIAVEPTPDLTATARVTPTPTATSTRPPTFTPSPTPTFPPPTATFTPVPPPPPTDEPPTRVPPTDEPEPTATPQPSPTEEEPPTPDVTDTPGITPTLEVSVTPGDSDAPTTTVTPQLRETAVGGNQSNSPGDTFLQAILRFLGFLSR